MVRCAGEKPLPTFPLVLKDDDITQNHSRLWIFATFLPTYTLRTFPFFISPCVILSSVLTEKQMKMAREGRCNHEEPSHGSLGCQPIVGNQNQQMLLYSILRQSVGSERFSDVLAGCGGFRSSFLLLLFPFGAREHSVHA